MDEVIGIIGSVGILLTAANNLSDWHDWQDYGTINDQALHCPPLARLAGLRHDSSQSHKPAKHRIPKEKPWDPYGPARTLSERY
jgi:hypothetical protein